MNFFYGNCRYLKCDLETFDLHELDCKFDSIMIEPPLEEYQRTLGVTKDKYWSWEEVGAPGIIQIIVLFLQTELSILYHCSALT